jgi:hypothetical protein
MTGTKHSSYFIDWNYHDVCNKIYGGVNRGYTLQSKYRAIPSA